MARIERFEDLEIWKKACALSTKVYRLTESCRELQKDYGLRDQMRRAAVSIASNIAEGFERHSKKDFIRFLYLAKGSAGELRTQLHIACEIGHISRTDDILLLFEEVLALSRQIGRFIEYLKADLDSHSNGS